MNSQSNEPTVSPWPHRAAVALAVCTFPLIWVGGLVTTYDAGMAVPDWPSTYGYNLFLYPWQSWIAGPWDLFIEHGHRLLASFVGFLAIVACVMTWKCEPRRWVRWFAVGAVALVIFQGLLGGARVLMDARRVAQIHGIVGPLFFVYTAVFAGITAQWWRKTQPVDRSSSATSITAAGWFVALLAFLQLVLGSQLRHVSAVTGHQLFAAAVTMHVVVAVLFLFYAPVLVWRIQRAGDSLRLLRSPSRHLALFLIVQVGLGVATWIAKYGMPGILVSVFPPGFTIQAEGFLASISATAHVANGALILATAVTLALRATRLARSTIEVAEPVAGGWMGATA